jgi:hypothetical protein
MHWKKNQPNDYHSGITVYARLCECGSEKGEEKEMEEKNFIRMTDDGAKCVAVLG